MLEEQNDLLFEDAVQHKITSLGGSIVGAANWSIGSNVLQFNYNDLPVQVCYSVLPNIVVEEI